MSIYRISSCVTLLLLSVACSGSARQSEFVKAESHVASDPASVAAPQAAPSPVASTSQRRFIIVLLDVSKSFQHLAEARRQVEKLVAALGPGDTLLIALITGSFNPAVNLVVPSPSLSGVFPGLRLQTPANLREQNKLQAALNEQWRAIAAQQQAITQALQEIKSQALFTDLAAALAYAAQQFSQTQDVSKHLFLFTDLEQDAHATKTNLPPQSPAPGLKDTRVLALFVPWRDAKAWDRLTQAWQDWAVACGAASLSLHDPGQSLRLSLLAPNTAPKQVARALAHLRN